MLIKRKVFKNFYFINLLPFFVLCLSLAISYQLYSQAKDVAKHELKREFEFEALEIDKLIEQRLRTYTQALKGSKGLFTASKHVNRQEFKAYVGELQLEKFYPGIQGLAFAVVVLPDEKEKHIAEIKKEGFSNYKIYPEGERELFYTAIIYIEPFSERNLRAFGYDMYSETVRRTAMQRAVDNNEAAMSGKIKLVQETEHDVQSGFIIYLPLYRKGVDISTLEARRSNIIAWHYAVFRMNDLMQGILGDKYSNIDINIYDKEDSPSSLMYKAHRDSETHQDLDAMFSVPKHIEIAGHVWFINIHSDAEFEAQLDLRPSHLIAISGGGGSLMLSWIIWLLVSGRKRALQAAQKMTVELSERETRYRQMFEENSCPAVLINPKNGDIINANLAASNFWGYSREELRRMNLSVIENSDPLKLQDIFQKIAEGSQQFQSQHCLKDGKLREIEVYAGPIAYQGETVFYAIFHDITARIRFEKALQESKARWKFAIEGAGDGVWDWEFSTGKVIFSKRWKEMLGYQDHEITDSIIEWEKRVHPDDKPRIEATLGDYFSGLTSSYISEHRMRCKDNSWKWILDRGMIVSRDEQGNPERIIGTHTDISMQKETETILREAQMAAEQANKAKSEFIANMSHEIRTPMNAILGFTDILSDIIDDSVQRHYLNAIHSSGKTLLQLINDILDLSKIEAGKLELQYSSVSIRSLIEDVGMVFSQKLSNKEIEFTVEITEEVPDYLMLDEIRLRQVLLNLIGNAVKFTENGFVRVSVTIEPIKRSNKINLMIIVCDSGIGIAKDQQEKIFSSFTQQDKQSVSYGGTGLGLTICRRLLELMNGHVSINSESGKGSCFTVRLDNIEVLQSTPTVIKGSEKVETQFQFYPAKILLVDDIAFNRQLIHVYLHEFSELTLIDATNGKETLALCLSELPDLILMDRRLPDEDGDTICRQIKTLPECANIPIIMVTASVLPLLEQKNIAYDLQLNKPVDKSELLSALKSFLSVEEALPAIEPEAPLSSENIVTTFSLEEAHELIELFQPYQASIKKLQQSGAWDVDVTIDMAEQLMQLAEKYAYPELERWAKNLKYEAELFEVAAVQKILNNFESLLTPLNKHL